MGKRKVYKVTGFLARTVRKQDDREAVELNTLVNEVAAENGGEVAKFEVDEGVAFIDLKGDEQCEAAVKAIFESLEGVKVESLSPFQIQLERNKKRQAKADAMKKKRQQNSAK